MNGGSRECTGRLKAGVSETLAVYLPLSRRHGVPLFGGSCRGYGWPATLELLSPPIAKPVVSRQMIKMNICPACGSVHEEDGDCTPSRQFDDLTLWNKTLTQGEIRALNYLDRGLNGIVVPRGLFFQSQFFSNLNTTTFSQSSPVVGSTVMGNDNPGELNARTIQQLIAANLTLAAAWTWIQELMTAEDTGNVTSFPLVVTGEVYTLGLDRMVLNVLANMTVQNSGNSSEPPPPIREPTFWESAWNSFTGLLSAAWNAVVAVATFVANVALAVIKWCIDFAVAIANGEGLQFFYDTVVKPFVDAILAFIRWIIDMIIACAKALFSPLINAYNDMIRGINGALEFARHNSLTAAVATILEKVFLSPFTIFMIACFVALTIVMKWTELLGIGKIIALVVEIIVMLYITVQMLKTFFDLRISDLIPEDFDDDVDWSFTLSDFVIASSLAVAGALRTWKTFEEAISNLVGSALALIFLSVSMASKSKGPSRTGLEIAIMADAMGLVIAFGGVPLGMDYEINPNIGIGKEHSLLKPLSDALAFYAKATSVSSLTSDFVELITLS
jgi:hypothetical protein